MPIYSSCLMQGSWRARNITMRYYSIHEAPRCRGFRPDFRDQPIVHFALFPPFLNLSTHPYLILAKSTWIFASFHFKFRTFKDIYTILLYLFIRAFKFFMTIDEYCSAYTVLRNFVKFGWEYIQKLIFYLSKFYLFIKWKWTLQMAQ